MVLRLVPLDLGPLPAQQINQILSLSLESGCVRFSTMAQQHAYERHPEDFALCLRHIAQIVAKPDFVGRGPHQSDGFELIGTIRQENAIILVAIKLRPDRAGRYIVASTYSIDRSKLERRLRKGFITRTEN